MTKPETLADMVYKATFSNHWCRNADMLRKRMLEAQRFVLDDRMSSFMQDLALAAFLPKNKERITLSMGGLSHAHLFPSTRVSNKLADQIRISARLPHRVTWIEYNSDVAYKRDSELSGVRYASHNIDREGWLLEQHPTCDTAFTAHMMLHTSVDTIQGKKLDSPLAICPFMLHWMVDDQPSIFHNALLKPKMTTPFDDNGELLDISFAEMMVGLKSYKSDQVAGDRSPYCVYIHPTGFEDIRTLALLGPCFGILRQMWALLATINDIPVLTREIRTSKGFIGHGSYRRFLNHHTIVLNVPEKKDVKVLARKIVAATRRRVLHRVRAHWRKDWHHPPHPMCRHEWDTDNECIRCHGYRLWIKEHKRGDPSQGILFTDYDVRHP